MKTQQHTPGDWRIDEGVLVMGPNRELIARVIYNDGKDTRQANIRLIAASPGLLQALQDLVEPYGAEDSNWQIEQARAAIARATGQTHVIGLRDLESAASYPWADEWRQAMHTRIQERLQSTDASTPNKP